MMTVDIFCQLNRVNMSLHLRWCQDEDISRLNGHPADPVGQVERYILTIHRMYRVVSRYILIVDDTLSVQQEKRWIYQRHRGSENCQQR